MTTVVIDTAVDILSTGFLDASTPSDTGHHDSDVQHVSTAAEALSALRAGRHVIFDTVPALSVETARAIRSAARGAGLVAAVPFVARYHPAITAARQRVARGEIGMLLSVQGAYLQDALLGADGDDTHGDSRSRVFATIGAHVCDLIEFVSGERIARVSARTRRVYDRRSGRDVVGEDLAAVIVETSSGALGTVLVTKMAPGRTDALQLELHGTAASIRFSHAEPRELWVGRRSASRSEVAPAAGDARGAFHWDAYGAIEGGSPRQALPTARDLERAAALAEAVVASAEGAGWVDTPEDSPDAAS